MKVFSNRAGWAARLALGVAACLLVLFAAWPLIAPRLVFMPAELPAGQSGPAPRFQESGAEEVWIQTSDGLRLHAWWFPAQGTAACGSLLYFHGNKGNVSSRGWIAERLAREGLDVLLVGYRGYGASQGEPSEEGFARDAAAAYQYVGRERGVAADSILVMGHSLGAAVASQLASRVPVAGVVLASPFSSLPGAMRDRLPWLPDRISDAGGHRFAAIEAVPFITAPILFIRGRDDPLTSRPDALRLFRAAAAPKRWVELAGARHNDVIADVRFREELRTFRDRALGCPPQPRRSTLPGDGPLTGP